MGRFEKAKEHLDRVVRQGIARHRMPAVSIAWTDRNQTLHVGSWGFQDMEKEVALDASHLFNFGSIGKSFTCIALLQAEEKGWIDLQAEVTDYLPWFEVGTKYRPITLHDMMTHASGLPGGMDEETEALGEVWNLRHLKTGFAPGEAFYYSNSAYKTLGLVLEQVYGKPYPEIIRQNILTPLGMHNSVPALTHAVRPRFARGYRPLYDDRPQRGDEPLVPIRWIESATGDGCISSNAADLAVYARMLLNRGKGESGRILSEKSFVKMTQPYQMRSADAGYGYGLMVREEVGVHYIGHGGSIPGYLAFLDLDMDNGLGSVILMAEPAAEELEGVSLKTLQSGVLEQDLPESPYDASPLKVASPQDYEGVYKSEQREFAVRAVDDHLVLMYCGDVLALEPRGKDKFFLKHPDFELFLLRFGRSQEAGSPVVEAFYGGEWFRREGAEQQPYRVPEGWEAYTGHYRSHNIWMTNFRIVIRKDKLMLLHPEGREAILQPEEDGSFLVAYVKETTSEYASDVHCERIRFDALADGKMLMAYYSGAPFYRFFTP